VLSFLVLSPNTYFLPRKKEPKPESPTDPKKP
jgi:hypothetical protein